MGRDIFCTPTFVAKIHSIYRYTVASITCLTVTRGVKNFQSKAWPTSGFVCIDVNDTAKGLIKDHFLKVHGDILKEISSQDVYNRRICESQ